MDEKTLIGKRIKSIDVSGYGITLKTEDGLELDYYSSDGGYSSWEINRSTEIEDGK